MSKHASNERESRSKGSERPAMGAPANARVILDLPPSWQTSEIKTHPRIKVKGTKLDPNNRNLKGSDLIEVEFSLPRWLFLLLGEIAGELDCTLDEALLKVVTELVDKPGWELPPWLLRIKRVTANFDG